MVAFIQFLSDTVLQKKEHFSHISFCLFTKQYILIFIQMYHAKNCILQFIYFYLMERSST